LYYIHSFINSIQFNSIFTQGWAFTDFTTAATIIISYVAFVFIGTKVMKTGGVPAMDPYPIKFIYNVSQIFLCSYMSIEAALLAYRSSYTLHCNDYINDNPPIANILWLFYISKIWDLWDTIFIVIGKKWRQLSFLHVYHHASIIFVCWFNINLQYDGDVFLTIFLNSFIHTIMYTYYFICMHTKDTKTGKHLPIWWKSSLTMLQMIQFMTMMVQATAQYLFSGECTAHNSAVTAFYFYYVLLMLGLFLNFFVVNYIKPKKKKKMSKAE